LQGARLTEPVTLWKDVTEKSRNKDRAFASLGKAYLRAGRNEEAAAAYVRVFALNPYDVKAYINAGLAFLMQNDLGRARDLLLEALRFDPSNWAAYNNLGIVYSRLGERARAVEMFNKVITLRPSLREGYRNRGIEYLAEERYDSAITDLKEAITDPGHAATYADRGTAVEHGKDQRVDRGFYSGNRKGPGPWFRLYQSMHCVYQDRSLRRCARRLRPCGRA
jgi:Flp pilus assembly protein TadD